MKNKITILLFSISLIIASINIGSTNEIIFDVSEITISDKGNIINATNGSATSLDSKIEIEAKTFEYNKRLSTLISINAFLKTLDGDIEIKADEIRYNKSEFLITAKGNVEVNDLSKKILITSKNISFDTKKQTIKSENDSRLLDNMGNIFIVKGFNYMLDQGLLKIENAKIVDFEKNKYQVIKAFINLKSNKLIGKDVSIDFNNKSFKKNNEPRLKGNSIIANEKETVITKGVFTACKKNDDCPPWALHSNKITHNKKKKTIYYKNAWLKVYDIPVFYFPKFFHPDPTVKRQSGFLTPKFTDSSSIGASFNVPYYHVISGNKDMTISPRFYPKKLLLQTEYREVNKDLDHIIDFSFMEGIDTIGKTHFFSQTNKEFNLINFDEGSLSLNLQYVSGDTYLKSYKIKSPLVNADAGILTSSLKLNAYRDDLSINTDFYIYEDLSKDSSNRYEYVYPNFSIAKQLKNKTKLDGDFSINSSGYLKNYNTNINKQNLVNDLTFNSSQMYSKIGMVNNYNFLVKNVNSHSSSSSEKNLSRIASIAEFNSSYPMKKLNKGYTNILKPMTSLKFSPNKTNNMSNDDRKIDISNIFSLNRIASGDTVEGGASLTYGLEFSSFNKLDRKIFTSNIASIIRAEKNEDLPKNSKLGEKNSDIVGNITYDPNEILILNYDYSIDKDLKETNYQLLSTEIKINNFISTFEYLNENNTDKSLSYLTNKTTYNFNDSKSFYFETRKNKKTGLTEFHNLIYQYRNDCLTAAIEYNKDYYSDRDLKPDESIFFKLKIIPFGATSSPNLRK